MSDERVRATATSIRILEAIVELDGEAGITELAGHLSLAKSTIFKHLNTLEENGLVVEYDDRYRIGLRALEFGGFAQLYDGIYDTAYPEVRQLADESGELANLMFEEGGKGVYVYTAAGPQAVDIDTQTGRQVHLHSTGIGKAVLATMSDDRIEEIIETHGLPAATEHTITDRAGLFDEIETIREEGIAYDREEFIEGMACLARPLTVPGPRPAAISITGPASRVMTGETERQLRTSLDQAGNVIELNLKG